MTVTRINPDNAAFVSKRYDLTSLRVEYVPGQQRCTLIFNDLYSIDFKPTGIEMWKNNNGTWSKVWTK